MLLHAWSCKEHGKGGGDGGLDRGDTESQAARMRVILHMVAGGLRRYLTHGSCCNCSCTNGQSTLIRGARYGMTS